MVWIDFLECFFVVVKWKLLLCRFSLMKLNNLNVAK